MGPWPEGWRDGARPALVGCDCCGFRLERPVLGSLHAGQDTGLACGRPACPLCAGYCRCTLVVLRLGRGEAAA